ncbi:MAG: TetR/AcrR family transcriptional regulator [Ilumatobacteraceae bacterium]
MSDVAATTTGAWAHHRADVEERIVNAFLELLETQSPTTVSMPAIAARAGISVRTLYRYFPTRQELQRAAATWFDDWTRRRLNNDLSQSTMREYMQLLWVEMAGRLAAVRVQHVSPDGRAMRAARLDSARRAVDHELPPELTGARRAEIVDLIVAISSSSMLLELVDRMGHDPRRAADLVSDLVELIITTESGRGAGRQEDTP